MKIAIMGMGAFGTALGGVLADNGYDIDYYDRKIEKERLTDVIDGARYLVIAVPSKALPYLLPHLPKNLPTIVATKGILTDELFAEFKDWMVLSGPGFADEIKKRQETKWTVTDERLLELFRADYIKMDFTTDKKGVLICGALKNAYAILAGFLNLLPGSEEWEQYLKNVAKEMKLILSMNGAEPETFELACGKGDLRLTCALPSRNYEYGQKIRKNPKYSAEKTVEGLSALAEIRRGKLKLPENATLLKTLLIESKTWH